MDVKKPKSKMDWAFIPDEGFDVLVRACRLCRSRAKGSKRRASAPVSSSIDMIAERTKTKVQKLGWGWRVASVDPPGGGDGQGE